MARRASPGCLFAAGGAFLALGLFVWSVVTSLQPASPAGSAGAASGQAPAVEENPAHLTGAHVDAARALTGLRIGDAVAGARLVAVRPPQDRQLLLDFQLGAARFTVMLARKEAGRPLPPEATERYAVYVSSTEVPLAEWRPVLDAVAARVKEREASAPVPAEL